MSGPLTLLSRNVGRLRRELAEFHEILADKSRYVDMRVELRNNRHELLCRAGGIWDRLLHKYVSDERLPDSRPHVVIVEPSQFEATGHLETWLALFRDGLPREIALEMFADLRRGGKTFMMVLWVLVAALHCPYSVDRETGARVPFIGWLVVPNYPRQREIHEDISTVLPRHLGLWRYRGVDRCYEFPNGSRVYIKSADEPDSLKQGRVDVVGINEAQQIHGSAIIHALGNNIDKGGLTIVALNPPDKLIGQWALDLHDAVKEGRLPYARLTEFPASKNTRIDQAARVRFAAVAGIIDPKLEKRDAQGMWLQITDRAYPKWTAAAVQPLPSWQDITPHIIGMMRLTRGINFQYGAGLDFNWRPYCAAVRIKIFQDPMREMGGKPLICYWVEDEVVNDVESGEFWTEQGLSMAMFQHGWTPDTTLFIADASGSWQNARDRRKGGVEAGHRSYDIFERDGWRLFPPQEAVYTATGPRGETRQHTQNPLVQDRLNLVNRLLEEGRLFVDPECELVAEAFKKCEAKNKKPVGRFSHLTDAAGYFLWRAENAANPQIVPRRRRR